MISATRPSARDPRTVAFIVTILALALLAILNTLPNGFTYDDRFIVVGNPAVRQIGGWRQFLLQPYWPFPHGGDGYRPLTTLLLAIEWAISRDPLFFHAISGALYAACSLAVFWLAGKITTPWIAWWTAALFAVHPVHVEAVAGAVGQAELAAALLMLLAIGIYLVGRRRGRLSAARRAAIAILFLGGCLFKEHAFVLPALLVLTEWAFVDQPRGLRARLRQEWRLVALLSLAALGYVAARSMVVQNGLTGFAPYMPFLTLHADLWDRALTMLAVIPHWFRLLFFPLRLSTEYGPPAYPVGGPWQATHLIGLALACLVAVAGLCSARLNRRVLAFAMGWSVILILPVSNVIPSGILIAERTLFAPSVGACLVVATAIVWAKPHVAKLGSLARTLGLVAAGSLLVFGLIRTVVRDADWRDNESLFDAAVKDEPKVYRAHYMRAAWDIENRRWTPARRELVIAMRLFDRDPAVAYSLGVGYMNIGDYARAFEMFQTVQRVMPGVLDARTKMALALAGQGRLAEARDIAIEALLERSEDPVALRGVIRAAAFARNLPIASGAGHE
jgi:hypothetical protein